MNGLIATGLRLYHNEGYHGSCFYYESLYKEPVTTIEHRGHMYVMRREKACLLVCFVAGLH